MKRVAYHRLAAAELIESEPVVPQRWADYPLVNLLSTDCRLTIPDAQFPIDHAAEEMRNRDAMSTTKTKWSFEADFLQACNCDYGCPCEFSAPPTRGFCEGTGAWNILKGHYGEISLDGLSVGFAAHWPKAIHEGNGTLAVFLDERASPAQRESLLKICSGEAGGLPFEILATTISKVLDPIVAPIQFTLNGRNSSVRIGNALNVALEPIKNPVTQEPESVRVEHATGFIFKSAEAVSGRECLVNVPGLSFSWPNKAGFVARVNYGN